MSGRESVDFARLLVLKSGLKLEILGMKRRGRSIGSILKTEFGFKGDKKKLLPQLEALIAQKESEAGL